VEVINNGFCDYSDNAIVKVITSTENDFEYSRRILSILADDGVIRFTVGILHEVRLSRGFRKRRKVNEKKSFQGAEYPCSLKISSLYQVLVLYF
jgi:hypothetical protein